MRKTEPNEASLKLNVSNQLLSEIDGAVDLLECNRTHFIRQSIRRNIEYFKSCELPVISKMKQKRNQYQTHPEPNDQPVQDEISKLFANAY
tara:strand:+ start:147 stop:419 length:273 start_codon:yes stop_codon:yes gene_type:complete